MRLAPEPDSVPWVGWLTIANANGSPSTSVPDIVTTTGVSSAVVTEVASATGESFTGETAIDTVAGADVARPSLTVNVNESEPLKFAAGV